MEKRHLHQNLRRERKRGRMAQIRRDPAVLEKDQVIV